MQLLEVFWYKRLLFDFSKQVSFTMVADILSAYVMRSIKPCVFSVIFPFARLDSFATKFLTL